MKITSTQNSHIKELVKLQEKKYRDKTNEFLIEGDHLVQEALKYNLVKEIITTNENLESDTYVTSEIMQKLSKQKSIPEIIAVCSKLEEKKFQNKILVLDDIQDPGNLGTIIRSAVAFNFTDIILSSNTVDLYNDKVIRSSEGMIFNINIIRKDLLEFLNQVKENYQILVTDVKEGENIKNISLKDNLILIIGNEGKGVSENVKKMAHNLVKINMNKNCESLNASIATGILLYEISEACHE